MRAMAGFPISIKGSLLSISTKDQDQLVQNSEFRIQNSGDRRQNSKLGIPIIALDFEAA
jgi:hypothetical protein